MLQAGVNGIVVSQTVRHACVAITIYAHSHVLPDVLDQLSSLLGLPRSDDVKILSMTQVWDGRVVFTVCFQI